VLFPFSAWAQVFPSFSECNTYCHTMNHEDEHPLVVALAWTLTGATFAVYVLVRLGAVDAMIDDNHLSERLELYEPRDISTGNQEAD